LACPWLAQAIILGCPEPGESCVRWRGGSVDGEAEALVQGSELGGGDGAVVNVAHCPGGADPLRAGAGPGTGEAHRSPPGAGMRIPVICGAALRCRPRRRSLAWAAWAARTRRAYSSPRTGAGGGGSGCGIWLVMSLP